MDDTGNKAAKNVTISATAFNLQPLQPKSRDLPLIFGIVYICTVNHHPPVGLCLDSNEDR